MSLNLKNLVLPMSFALGFTFLIQYLFINKTPKNSDDQLESGRSHVAPRAQEVHRPLDTEINFDIKPDLKAEKVQIETDFAKYVFSTHGAAIEQIEYKHLVNSKNIYLKTFNSQAREDKCLLVAFPEKTPFHYQLINKEENDNAFILSYRAPFDNGIIEKKFVIYKHLCQLDVEIGLMPEKTLENPLRLRVFYPSPLITNLSDDLIQAIMNEGNVINKKGSLSFLNRYWEVPSLFGLEDRYFVHAMVKDTNYFVQRGYYKSTGLNSFFAILEGPASKEKASWNLSFYFGPKKLSTINNVDSRLERNLDYGYLAPLTKPLLSTLNFFYKYFKSYGLAIILLTFLIKLLLLPFTLKSEQSMKKRLEFQKKLQYIQQKYKDDNEALIQARAELLKKQGLGDVAGCLPLLLQLPIFFALNRILSTAIELYQAPFLWIPNLSAKDPFYIIPLLIGLSIVLYSTSSDPRQRFTSYGMALLLAAFSAGLPSGLSLFIFMSSILTVGQSKLHSIFKKA